MKLRIKGNSLRLRLTRPEVQRLVEQGSVTETTTFAGAAEFSYAVRADAAAKSVMAEYEAGCMTVTIPAKQAAQWAASELVGVYNEMAGEVTGEAAANGTLTIAVEKDFACIDRDDPEDADAFPNPKRDGC